MTTERETGDSPPTESPPSSSPSSPTESPGRMPDQVPEGAPERGRYTEATPSAEPPDSNTIFIKNA